jgi:hypothetical protein
MQNLIIISMDSTLAIPRVIFLWKITHVSLGFDNFGINIQIYLKCNIVIIIIIYTFVHCTFDILHLCHHNMCGNRS